MNFFITGKITSKKGPLRILQFSLFLLLSFIILHGIRESLQIGTSIESIARALHKSGDFGERSLLLAMEELHIQFFLLSILVLFLGTLLYFLPLSHKQKHCLFAFLSLCAFLYPISKLATYFIKEFSWLVFFSAWLFHFYTMALIVVLFLYLSFSDESS